MCLDRQVSDGVIIVMYDEHVVNLDESGNSGTYIRVRTGLYTGS
jgi:hypothetical protein